MYVYPREMIGKSKKHVLLTHEASDNQFYRQMIGSDMKQSTEFI